MSDASLPDLTALVQQLKGDLFVRWTRRAQKAALIEWRDRRESPGLAARFTAAGSAFYGFGERPTKYNRGKGSTQDYVKTGDFRDSLKLRKPRAIRGTGDTVTTRLRYGGGVLNFLTKIGPMTNEARIVERIPVQIRGYSYRVQMNLDKTGGREITVRGHTAQRQRIRRQVTRSSTSYAAEFGRFVKDQPWIAQRTAELFAEIVRKAAFTKGGKLKSSVLQEVDDAG